MSEKQSPRQQPRARKQNKCAQTISQPVKRRKPTILDCENALDRLANASPSEVATALSVAAAELKQAEGEAWQEEAQQTLLQVAKGSEVEAPAAQQIIEDGFRCEAHPDGRFSLESDGLWFTELKENSDPKRTWLGPPLLVLGQTRDEQSKEWGLLLKWFDPDGKPHTWAMPKSLLVGKDRAAWLGRLVGEGWCAAPGQNEQRLLAIYLMTHKTNQRVRCVPKTGWCGDAFVFPDGVVFAGTNEEP